jgi:UDP-N-acetylmuramate: L-alanyl-gamma-D-glutamyl-meso-diaminopimelate ligase
VVEGDEYDTAYFDKGPKFLHYRAKTAILTSIEFDHADIYRDMPHYESAFVKFADTMPADGTLAVCASYPNAVAIARRANRARVVTYGADERHTADYSVRDLTFDAAGAHFVVREPDGDAPRLLLPMAGRHNVENAIGVYAASRSLGLTSAEIAAGFASFRGVKRRQEVRGEPNDILVIDDFAHHPTAVRETIHAIKLRYPTRRLWAVFEPRSNTSRRNIHQREYAESFDGAQRVSLKVPEPHDKVPANEQLSVPAVAEALREHGLEADYSADVSELVARVANEARRGDVVLVMSNGAFGGFIPSLIGALESRSS